MTISEYFKLKTIFQTKFYHFKYNLKIFILFNSSANFEQYINKILFKIFYIFIIIYSYDIILNRENLWYSHINVVNKLMKPLKKYSI